MEGGLGAASDNKKGAAGWNGEATWRDPLTRYRSLLT